jgi:hypothetical protein
VSVADRKSVVQVTTRFRKDTHRRLLREAKARDISMSQEIERRIESSFGFEDWQTERLDLLTALRLTLMNNPQTSEVREDWKKKRVGNLFQKKLKQFLDEVEETDERDFQRHDLPKVIGNEKPRTG